MTLARSLTRNFRMPPATTAPPDVSILIAKTKHTFKHACSQYGLKGTVLSATTPAMTTNRRRTQRERTDATRIALADAAIKVIDAQGYAKATTALIADEAGVTRGAILHHFGTRDALMAHVLDVVFEREMAEYERILATGELGAELADWPKILWSVLTRPAGVAALEILHAARTDRALSEMVVATQVRIEADAVRAMASIFDGDDRAALRTMRLMVGAVRGLTLASRLMPDTDATDEAIDLLSALLRQSNTG